MALNNEGVAFITINGKQGQPFNLKSLIRHGCSLVSYLFLFAMNVLGHMLDDVKHNVEGLIKPN